MANYQYRTITLRDFDVKEQMRARTQARLEAHTDGQAGAVLQVLRARGVEVPQSIRTQILACADLDMIDTWLRRAATADSVEDVVGETARPAETSDDPPYPIRCRFHSDFFRGRYLEAWANGLAADLAELRTKRLAYGLLSVLHERDVFVTEPVRILILACADADQLEAWLYRAATANTVSDFF